ncbi:hypothetical protein MASR2M64_05250 [Candidatus Cloacimonadota bacterium]
MKKVLFLMVLCLLVLGMKAQTAVSSTSGLFGLWFGDDYDTCDENLYWEGFEYYDDTDDGGTMYIPDGSVDLDYDIDSIALYFENGTDELTGWLVLYTLSDDYDVEQSVVASLKSMHGAYGYNPEAKFYSWDFDETHFLEAAYNNDGDLFYAEYGTIFGD